MPDKRTATFRVQDGRIARSAQKWIVRQIQQYQDGDHVTVTLAPPTRSLKHNNFYFGFVIAPILKAFREAGMTDFHLMAPGGELVRVPLTKQMLHEWFKAKYIPEVAPEQLQDDKPLSTRRLTDTQMSAYIELIRQDEDVLDAGVFIERESYA